MVTEDSDSALAACRSSFVYFSLVHHLASITCSWVIASSLSSAEIGAWSQLEDSWD